jgi:D-alanine-D-alanine ligase
MKTTNLKSRIRVAVLFGGRSAEHEVSLVSATSVINALDRRKYEVVPIGITREGRWLTGRDTLKRFKMENKLSRSAPIAMLPDPNVRGVLDLRTARLVKKSIDVVFPVLHGTYGEDGTVQGLFELAGVAYVGAGVLGSAASMDKVVAKQLFRHAGLPVTGDVWFSRKDFGAKRAAIVAQIERKLTYPCFVKPSNLGSSVGITKAHNRKELLRAIELAGTYDRRILVEAAVLDAREIEVSVLGNDEPIASVPGEIVPSNEFYDYDAKYVDGKSEAIIPAKLPKAIEEKLQDHAIRAFRAVDCAGMARVDFLLQRRTNKLFVNEINTIPGFTSISMYPKLWEASGIPYPKLLDRLITLALERQREKARLRTAYKPKADWYNS